MNLPDFQTFDNLFYGLDLAKKDSQLAIVAPDGQVLANLRFPSTRENFLQIAGHLRPQDTIALEVSNSANAVMSIFRLNSEARALLSNPLQTKVISETRCKTDQVDARVLADLARIDYLPTVWFPDADTLRLRHFFTDRELLVRHRTQFKNQLHSILQRSLVRYETADLFTREGRVWLDSLLKGTLLDPFEKDRIHFLLGEITRQDALLADLDATIAAFIRATPAFARPLDLLLSIPGIALATGGAILAAIGDISRFSDKKKLASYFGLTPKVIQSGEKCRMGRISKKGNAYGRFMAIEAAEHFRKVPVYERLFQKIAKKKGHNLAKVALARKLIELVWTLLTREEEFIYARPRLTDEKRAEVRQLAKSKCGLKAARKPVNQALHGTNLRGREIKGELQKRAAEEAARIAGALEAGKKPEKASPTGFDPRRPSFVDWQKLLEIIAEKYAAELAAEKSPEKAEQASLSKDRIRTTKKSKKGVEIET